MKKKESLQEERERERNGKKDEREVGKKMEGRKREK